MPVAEQVNQVVGTLALEEATYGTPIALVNADDGCLPYLADGDPSPPSAIEYVYDGSIGRAPGNLAPQIRTTPNGRFRQSSFMALFRGTGANYSASVTPPREVHRFLKAAGFDAAYNASPSVQWTYTPTAAGNTFTSLTLREFMQGSIYEQAGVLCDWSYEAVGLGVPIHTFSWRGIVVAAPTDGALPTIAYPFAAQLPPVASAVVGNIGAWDAAMIRSVRYARNRSIDNPRVAMNLAGGHAGFVPGGAQPTMTLVVERSARSVYNAEAVMAAATPVAVNVQFGGTALARWKHTFAQSQLTSVTPQNDGPTATMELVFSAYASTPSANDFESVLFN